LCRLYLSDRSLGVSSIYVWIHLQVPYQISLFVWDPTGHSPPHRRTYGPPTHLIMTPSVKYLTPVLTLIASSNLTLYPTSSPHSHPISSATRRARAIQGNRRGWVIAIMGPFPPLPKEGPEEEDFEEVPDEDLEEE
jgi:hypothetical protein